MLHRPPEQDESGMHHWHIQNQLAYICRSDYIFEKVITFNTPFDQF